MAYINIDLKRAGQLAERENDVANKILRLGNEAGAIRRALDTSVNGMDQVACNLAKMEVRVLDAVAIKKAMAGRMEQIVMRYRQTESDIVQRLIPEKADSGGSGGTVSGIFGVAPTPVVIIRPTPGPRPVPFRFIWPPQPVPPRLVANPSIRRLIDELIGRRWPRPNPRLGLIPFPLPRPRPWVIPKPIFHIQPIDPRRFAILYSAAKI